MAAINIYSASAGSGKTFTLVKEYLKILFAHAANTNFHAFRYVLAITFTNKATEEMKQRIIGTLKDIAAGQPSVLLDALKKELPDIEDHATLADKLLIRMLHDFSNFNIQTIDSFFQDIIRSFARELDLPLNFEIELDTSKGLEYAADEVIAAIGFDEEVTTWLEAYALSLMKQDKNWNFRQHLLKISREVFDDRIDLAALSEQAAAIPGIKNELNKIIRSVEQQASQSAAEVLQLIEKSDVPEDAFAKAWMTNLRKTANQLRGLTIPVTKTFGERLSGDKPHLLKAAQTNYAAEMNLLEASGYQNAVQQLYKLLIEDMAISLAAKEALFNIYALGVIDKINDKLKQYRAENNLLFIADAARLIQGFIRLSDMPFLFEKTGSRIKYLFIDEFQDTSTLQWENVLPVLHNILSVSGSNMTVMLVGDAKQSIYRWRGGDYQLITGNAAKSLEPFTSETLDLDTNYRSLPGIINFNNTFFETVKSLSAQFGNPGLQEEIETAYRQVEQLSTTSEHQGHVKVQIIPKDPEVHWKITALEQLDEQLRELRAAGYEYHDIAILVNRRNEGVEISRHLQRSGIEVLSGETLLLKFDSDVRLLLAGLYYINQPKTGLYYSNLLWHFARKHQNATVSKSQLLADHKERKLLRQWLPKLHTDLEEICSLPSYQMVELLINELGISGGDNLFVSHFRQLVFEFFKKESPELEDLLSWWEENKDKASVNLEEGSGRVHVVTIHKSKGLEFPVVLIPFCDWKIYQKLHETLMWLSDEQLLDGSQLPVRATSAIENSIFGEAVREEKKFRWIDSLNVMYVAFTRAREVLYINCPEAELKQPVPISVAQLVGSVIGKMNDSEGDVYELGSLQRPAGTTASPSGEEVLSVSADTDYKPFGIQLRAGYESEQTRIGELVHITMQHLGPSGLDAAFQKALRSANYSPDEVNASRKHISSILKIDDLKNWMEKADEIWSEQDIWFKGQLLRPDKILSLKDKLIVIDFKTGDAVDAYNHKMQLYMDAVHDIFPNKKVEGYILYAERSEMIEVNG